VEDTAVTEIVELSATKVAGVASPANQTPFLLIKAADDEKEDCPTCKGKGKIMEGNRECPDCKGSGEKATKSDSAEADAQEDEMTDGDKAPAKKTGVVPITQEAIDAAVGILERETGDVGKAEESGKTQNDLPDSAFAHIESGGKKDDEGKTIPRSLRHYPVHDEAHAKNALGRAGAQIKSGDEKGKEIAKAALPKIKSAAKKFGIDVAEKAIEALAEEFAKSPGVPDESVQEPKVAGHLDGGKSGISGSLAVGTVTPPTDSALTLGGKTTADISALEAKVTNNPTAGLQDTLDGAGITNPQAIKGIAVASLWDALDQIEATRQAVKEGKFLQAVGDAALTPGSMPWESYDSATLKQVAECLAQCCNALDTMSERERQEGLSVDGSDMSNAWDLEEASSALEYAMGVAARLSFTEAVESETATKSAADTFVAKVGRKLSGKNADALRAARDHLNAVIDGAENDDKASDAGSTEEQEMALTVTKDELGELVVKSVIAVREQEKAENGGDISEGDIKPTSTHDADDIQSVGGSVDPKFVNKGAGDDSGALQKQVADQLETLTKGLSDVQEMVAKFAKRPRSGGPALDGRPRGIAPAAEGRFGEAAKGVDDGELETLQKSYDEAATPLEKERIGEELTKAQLTRAILNGEFGVPRRV